ncbi:hypothetical protein F2Q69_00027379 [Brassica cretica]|uniref:Uncharacterized protein n=1 Tax=Brassica cretica TaxID=69181 RepID=A0A8S9S836_BRACR|nr:hypothetical protein F2Q69_00027379 [Brassica cretica]
MRLVELRRRQKNMEMPELPLIIEHLSIKNHVQVELGDDLLHIDAWINLLRKRICFLDHLFAQQWRFYFKDFKDSEPDQNGLGKRLPEFSKKDFAKANGKTMRDKMAVDIFQELPGTHEFENKNNDANLGAYEG